MKRILNTILAVAAITLVAACSLKEDNEVFEKSSTIRLQELRDAAAAALTGAEHGWVLHYWPQSQAAGYVYTMVFKANGEVTVASERNGNTSSGWTEETSYYKIALLDGVTLSFDTYNSIFHYWTVPSGGNPDGLYGETDFIVQSVSDNKILLRGKRWEGIATMTPLPEAPQDYITNAYNARRAIDRDYSITVGGESFDANIYQTTGSSPNRYMTVFLDPEDEEAVLEVTYTVTPDGIYFTEPVNINGETFQQLKIDATQREIEVVDNPAVVFGHPSTYAPIENFAGNYSLVYGVEFPEAEEGGETEEPDSLIYGIKSVDAIIEVVESGEGDNITKSLVLKGLVGELPIALIYDDWTGIVNLRVQSLGSWQPTSGTTRYLRLCVADYNFFDPALTLQANTTFRYTVGATGQFTLIADSSDVNTITFINTYTWSTTRVANSLYLRGFSSATSTSTTASNNAEPSLESGLRFPNGEVIIPNVQYLIKK